MKLLLVLLWSALLPVAGDVDPLADLEPPRYANHEIVGYATETACEYLEMDCGEVVVPKVQFANLMGTWGAYGLYDYQSAPNTVWLDNRFEDGLADRSNASVLALSILIHEVVHYLDHSVNGSKFITAESACASEGMAWGASNWWLVEIGLPEMARWNWRVSYPHCR